MVSLDKEEKLCSLLREYGSLVVAFPAGVDSTLLLAAAVRVLGPQQVLAATSLTHSLPTLLVINLIK